MSQGPRVFIGLEGSVQRRYARYRRPAGSKAALVHVASSRNPLDVVPENMPFNRL